MQQVQLELARMQAEVQKLQSEAAVNIAKVQDVADVQPQLKMAELQTQIGIKEQELQLRRELASLTNQTRRSQQETAAATRIAATVMQTAAKTQTQGTPRPIPNMRPLTPQ